MKYSERIPKALFTENDHYLGRPADFDDKIVERRLRLIRQIDGFTNGAFSLLDIGCGNGASMFALSKDMKKCVGIEINDHHLPEFEKQKEKCASFNCEYTVLDIEKNHPPEEFDRIISFEVIEHLKDEKAVRFYYEALKKGGLMAISVPNKWWIFETHGAKLPLLPWNRAPFFSWLPRKIHEKYANARIYTKQRITDLLREHGFTVLSTSYITAPMDALPKGKFKDIVVRLFFNRDTTRVPFKSTSIFVVAKKP